MSLPEDPDLLYEDDFDEDDYDDDDFEGYDDYDSWLDEEDDDE